MKIKNFRTYFPFGILPPFKKIVDKRIFNESKQYLCDFYITKSPPYLMNPEELAYLETKANNNKPSESQARNLSDHGDEVIDAEKYIEEQFEVIIKARELKLAIAKNAQELFRLKKERYRNEQKIVERIMDLAIAKLEEEEVRLKKEWEDENEKRNIPSRDWERNACRRAARLANKMEVESGSDEEICLRPKKKKIAKMESEDED